MKIYSKNIIAITILALTLISCELFTTRDPEPPDKNKSSFVPPTSPSIVISNFISSIIEKNTSNYIACLSDTTQGDINQYYYYPTADALTIYSSVFQSWNLASERNYFDKLMTSTGADVKPELLLNNPRFEILLPDSALFSTDYTLRINHDINFVSKEFKGSLQFIIYPRNNGLWTIKQWTDINHGNDSIGSWSFLKAQLSN